MDALKAELSRKKLTLGDKKSWKGAAVVKVVPLLASDSVVRPIDEKPSESQPILSAATPMTENNGSFLSFRDIHIKREREDSSHVQFSQPSSSLSHPSPSTENEEREGVRLTADGDDARRIKRRKGCSYLEAKHMDRSSPEWDAHKYLYKFWKGLLSKWEEHLEGRPKDLANSPQGAAETASAAQTGEFMAPFFSLCKSRKVPPDMMPLCVELVDLLLLKEYMAAGDAYLRLSVGKAQWLMGVSQVGLHERAARERIYIGKLPHVLNDETQRRYLTSMKKLMTVLQRMEPPSDPSKAYMP